MDKVTRAARRAEREAQKARLEAARAEARRVVATGACPRCGSKLRYNGSLTGWWQCSQYGSEGFRADGTRASCPFQCFTE